MQLKCGLVVSSVLIFFLSFPVYSRSFDPVFQELKTSHNKYEIKYSHSIDPVFQELKTRPNKYEIKGTVCEEVARIQLEQDYRKDQFSVHTGIAYTQYNQTLGELDVVVFRNNDNKVVLIGEVKCWRNLDQARKKAISQRKKFREYLEHGGLGIDFHKTSDPRIHFNPKQFRDEPPFILISQEEGGNQGFDLALPFTLDELMKLRDMLVHCQDIGECIKALH